MNKNKEKKVNFLTPFFGAVQGKLPRYMADFFWIALGKDNVEFGLKINKEGFNFIYPIEFCPTPRRDKVIFLGPDSILLLFKRAIISREQFFFIKMLSLVRFVQYQVTYKTLDRNVPIITVGQDDAKISCLEAFVRFFI
jgi:hypothetical protein